MNLYLSSQTDLKKYIDRGTSEIHWNGKKLSHFNLMKELLNSDYEELLRKKISEIAEKFNVEKLTQIIMTIDDAVPEELIRVKIPDNRKLLIIKMITLRFENLTTLPHDRI